MPKPREEKMQLKLSLAWALLVVLAHFVLTYAFDPRYSQAFSALVSKFFGG